MFPISPDSLPSLRTRQALLVIDMQNDFILPDGALPVQHPDGLVARTIEVAKAFRDSGTGDVIWVRSEFERHQPLSPEGGQVVLSDLPQIPRRNAAMTRERQAVSGHHEQAIKEIDDEAFLSVPNGLEKPACVRPKSNGSRLVAEIEEAIDATRDVTLTKSHYSAFASGHQLLQLLRGRFATELYVCGALTNISIYATAMDAGQHGYDMTLVEDCCGYRSETRHENALRQLMDLTGCELINADELVEKRQRMKPPGKDESNRSQDRRPKASGGGGRGETARGSKKSPVRPLSPADDPSGLNLSMRNLTLSAASSAPQPSSPAQPQKKGTTHAQPPQAGVKDPVLPRDHLIDVDDGPMEPNSNSPSPSPPDARLEGGSRTKPIDDGGRNGSKSNLRASPRIPNSVRGDRSIQRSTSASLGAGSESHGIVDPRRQDPSGESPTSLNKQKVTQPPRDDRPSSEMEDQRGPDGPVPSEPLCEGDTTIIQNVLQPGLAETAFELLESEVKWLRMSHQGGEVPRLVAVQGSVDDEGNMPVYRHPADESPPLLPFSPTVQAIKAEVERHLGHPLNHVLIQFYRDGKDYISEHSDKTLDIVRGSFIANLSLGAERTMVFRTKRADKDPSRKHGKTSTGSPTATATAGPGAGAGASSDDGASAEPSTAAAAPGTTTDDSHKRRTERARLPHNSLCRMGLVTNMRWLHSIRQDKRLEREKAAAELAFGGRRISLTFRQIGTYLDAAEGMIWGQGARCKDKDGARAVVNGQTAEGVRMLQAFGTENHSSQFDWARHYGAGFDVLHMSTSPRWFAGPDDIVNARVALMLADLGVSYAKGSTGASAGAATDQQPDTVKFVDNDDAKSAIEGHVAIILYLDAVYGGAAAAAKAGNDKFPATKPKLAKRLTRFQQGLALLERWRVAQMHATAGAEGVDKKAALKFIRRELAVWNDYAKEEASQGVGDASPAGVYIAGGMRPSIADFAVWPVLHDMVRVCGEGFLDGHGGLARYYRLMRESTTVLKVLDGGDAAGGDTPAGTVAAGSAAATGK